MIRSFVDCLTEYVSIFENFDLLHDFVASILSTYLSSIKTKLSELHVDINIFSASIEIIRDDMKSISSILPPEFTVEEKLSELYEFALSS